MAEEQSLFPDMDTREATAQGHFDDGHTELAPQADDHELPAPAYQPQVAEFEPQQDTMEDSAETFVAPQRSTAGTPSPEAMERLRNAVSKTPKADPMQQSEQPRAVPAEADAERPRFGINSLINRMTGQAVEHQGERGAQPMRAQPPVQHAPDAQPRAAHQAHDAEDPDKERIEIPAFLRRQAN